MLNVEEKRALLDLARKTLESYLTNKTTPRCQLVSGALAERKGAFVTLHNGAELRGCIGQLSPETGLNQVVQHCVISAAVEDTRFLPVTKEELAELTIEISVLTPFRRIQQIEEIEIGRHGLYIVQGYFRGLLLPQVASEYGWDRTTFLKQACRKSGLPESAWQDPRTAIHIFEAEVFSE
jgi:AmmeMemoRadiSam system protein A